MRGDLRRENAEIYSEMYEAGIEPFRGSWKSITIMVLCFVIVISIMMACFFFVFAGPTWFLTNLVEHLFPK